MCILQRPPVRQAARPYSSPPACPPARPPWGRDEFEDTWGQRSPSVGHVRDVGAAAAPGGGRPLREGARVLHEPRARRHACGPRVCGQRRFVRLHGLTVAAQPAQRRAALCRRAEVARLERERALGRLGG